jgi:hypothetical protein
MASIQSMISCWARRCAVKTILPRQQCGGDRLQYAGCSREIRCCFRGMGFPAQDLKPEETGEKWGGTD